MGWRSGSPRCRRRRSAVPSARPRVRSTITSSDAGATWTPVRFGQCCTHGATQTAVARRLGLSWDEARGIMARAVRRALACRQPAVVPHLGIDETRFVKRHQSVSVVVDLDAARILHVADDRPAVSLAPFFAGLSEAQRTGSTAVAVDMWEPYRRTLPAHVPDAHRTIVFDTFPVMQHVLTAVDTVRKQEHRALAAAGTSPLTRTRYAWRKNPATFSAKAWRDFAALRNSTLPTARAWAMYGKSPPRTGGHLRGRRAHVLSPLVWLGDAIAPRVHEAGGPHTAGHLKNILTYLKHRITSAVTEGLNAKIQWIKTSARGYRNRGPFKIAISLHCGGLDFEPRGGGNPLQTRKGPFFLLHRAGSSFASQGLVLSVFGTRRSMFFRGAPLPCCCSFGACYRALCLTTFAMRQFVSSVLAAMPVRSIGGKPFLSRRSSGLTHYAASTAELIRKAAKCAVQHAGCSNCSLDDGR